MIVTPTVPPQADSLVATVAAALAELAGAGPEDAEEVIDRVVAAVGRAAGARAWELGVVPAPSRPSGRRTGAGAWAVEAPVVGGPCGSQGRLRLERSRSAEAWSPVEVALVRALADAIGRLTCRVAGERARRIVDARYRALADHAPDLLVAFDRSGRVRCANALAAQLVGRPADALAGHSLEELGCPAALEALWKHHLGRVLRTGEGRTGVFDFPSTVGPHPFEVRMVPDRAADGSLVGVVVAGVDRAPVPGLSVEASAVVNGLLPAGALREHVGRSLAGLDRNPGVIAVVVVDPHGGDGVEAAGAGVPLPVPEQADVLLRRIQGLLAAGDAVSRIDDDAFVVALGVRPDLDDVMAFAGRARGSGPGSVGVAVTSDPDGSPDGLIHDADAARYLARSRGGGRVELYRQPPATGPAVVAGDTDRLVEALEAGELVVHYQPVVRLDSGMLVGAEALVRWAHPDRGLLGAAHVVGPAEPAGLMVRIGARVLESACRQAAVWRELATRRDALLVRVNLSVSQLAAPGLVDDVERALVAAEADPVDVCLEVPEVAVAADPEARDVVRRLRSLGVRIAVDGVGTCADTLAYLRTLPVDLLNVDRRFVSRLGAEQADTAPVAALLGAAKTLRAEVVAAGVETGGQRRELLRLGCRLGQGYLFARPGPPERITAILLEGR